jgi:hypothetical protein
MNSRWNAWRCYKGEINAGARTQPRDNPGDLRIYGAHRYRELPSGSRSSNDGKARRGVLNPMTRFVGSGAVAIT